jgi:hypothetical protein
MFALLNASIYDGYIASFDSKFHYNHWRPYTAIRWASNDGNPDTAEDTDWTNMHDHTYAFPSYPSTHGTVCAAAMAVLADAFGDDRPFEMTIREVDSAGPMSPPMVMDPATRSFDSFAAAAEECALSRVCLGIHFRYDSEAGTALGRKVGQRVLDSLLVPVATAGAEDTPWRPSGGSRILTWGRSPARAHTFSDSTSRNGNVDCASLHSVSCRLHKRSISGRLETNEVRCLNPPLVRSGSRSLAFRCAVPSARTTGSGSARLS